MRINRNGFTAQVLAREKATSVPLNHWASILGFPDAGRRGRSKTMMLSPRLNTSTGKDPIERVRQRILALQVDEGTGTDPLKRSVRGLSPFPVASPESVGAPDRAQKPAG